MVVGRLLSYWVSVTFQGRTVKLREGKGSNINFQPLKLLLQMVFQPCWKHLLEILSLGTKLCCRKLGKMNWYTPNQRLRECIHPYKWVRIPLHCLINGSTPVNLRGWTQTWRWFGSDDFPFQHCLNFRLWSCRPLIFRGVIVKMHGGFLVDPTIFRDLPSLKLTPTWKWMVGQWLFPVGMPSWQVRTVSFRECI